jgi:hypothetical protein
MQTAGSAPGSHYLQQLEEQWQQRKQQQQQQQQAEAPAAAVMVHQQAGTDGSVQQLLHTSQELSRKTMQLQQGMQRQQSQSPRLASPGQLQQQRDSADDSCTQPQLNAACAQQPSQLADDLEGVLAAAQRPEQYTPAAAAAFGVGAAAGAGIGYDDSDDEDDSSSPDESVVKQRLRFGSASPAASLAGRLSDASTTPVAQGPTPDAVTPEASTPDMFAAARAAASCFKGGSSTIEEESPLLWGAAAAAARQSSSSEQQQGGEHQDQDEQGVGSSTALAGDRPACSVYTAAAAAAAAAGGDADMLNADKGSSAALGQAACQDAAGVVPQPRSANAAGGSSSDLQQLSSSERQRLQLLESVVQVMGGLYARG